METTIVYGGYIGIMIMEHEMEAASFIFEKSGVPKTQDTLNMRLS